MKRFLSIILTVIMIATSVMCVSVFAADEIKVTINGEEKAFDVTPVIINDRTLVPMRGIFEALGVSVEWDGVTQSVTADVSGSKVVLQVGKTVAMVNGQYVPLDAPARLIEGRTMVPVRFVAETLGCEVAWEDASRTVVIKGEVSVAPSTPAEGENAGGDANQGNTAAPVDDGWADLAVIGFEDGSAAPSSGMNFWAVKSDGQNANSKNKVVSYSEAGISKPSNTEDFGSKLLAVDINAGQTGEYKGGMSQGRINDIPADLVPYEAGGKYKMAMWVYLADGSGASVTLSGYSGKDSSAIKGVKFNLKAGEWQRIAIEFEADSKLVGQTTGARFAFGGTVNLLYIDNVSYEKPGSGSAGGAASAPSTPSTPSVPAQTVADAKLPTGGKVIATLADFATCVNDKTIKNKDGVIELNATKNESDNKIAAMVNTPLGDSIKEGNVYMLTFKARVVSGDPYLKGFIQAGKEGGFTKAVFAATSYGKEWTTCYMPFVGPKAKMDGGWGFRLAGATHVTQIKDLQIIDYGTSVKITDLPHTYIVVGNTAVSGLELK